MNLRKRWQIVIVGNDTERIYPLIWFKFRSYRRAQGWLWRLQSNHSRYWHDRDPLTHYEIREITR